MTVRHMGIGSLLERNRQRFAQRPAVIFEGQVTTHAMLFERAQRLATALLSKGLKAGERVAVIAQNRLEFLDLYGAAALAGLVLVPVNWRASAEEMVHAVTDTTPRLIVVDAQYQAAAQAARAACSSVDWCVSFGGAAPGFEAFDGLFGSAGAAVAPAPIDASAAYVVFHTAAVGGLPRGAVLSQAGLVAASAQSVHHWALGPDDVNLGLLPLFHVSGLGLFLATLMAGGCTVLAARFDAQACVRDIGEHRVTLFAEFAPILASILDAAAAGTASSEPPVDLSSLRVVSGLDSPQTMARLEEACPGARFWVGYGQSEVSGMVTIGRFRDQPGSAGQAALLSDVAVFDEHDQPCAVGTVGEIVVRGPTVFLCYWNRDDDNAYTLRDGWHHTGDMGRLDGDGWMWYAGRSPAKELIKPGGENVYPAEVERVLLMHPAIGEAVVFGVTDAQWGEAVKAVCVCKPGVVVPPAVEVIEFVGSRIARFKRPKHVSFVERLPRSDAGAIDRMQVKREHGGA